MTAKIDKGVPVPIAWSGSPNGHTWPWHDMEPGDSFFAAGYVQSVTQRTGHEPQINISTPRRVCSGSTWATRLVTESGVRGVRVWRVT